MQNQKDPLANSNEDLIAENNLLKVKLQLEHGMLMENGSTLSPDVENQWLKSVYAFEQQYKEAKKTKVYDRIGRPAIKKADELTAVGISEELQRLRVLMENNGIELDCICEYDDAVIYKFLTEELFEREMDDISVPGMVYHFIYEEFHPNHDYDLRRHATDFIKAIFARQWNDEFDGMFFARKVAFSGGVYERRGMSAIVNAFQEAHPTLEVDTFEIDKVAVDPGNTSAEVTARLSVSGKTKEGEEIRYEGGCCLHSVWENDYWYIDSFLIPGFNR